MHSLIFVDNYEVLVIFLKQHKNPYKAILLGTQKYGGFNFWPHPSPLTMWVGNITRELY